MTTAAETSNGTVQPSSRPLSEISANAEKRRSTAWETNRPEKKTSRPSSEVREPDAKRQSLSAPAQTITVNLAGYAPSSSSSSGPPPPSPSTKPSMASMRSEKGVSLGRPLSTESREGEPSKAGPSSETQDGVSQMLLAKRASLRPSPLTTTYADILKPLTSPSALSPSVSDTFDESRSSTDLSNPPFPKSKPSWLRRASMNPSLRSKSRSPASSSEHLPDISPSLPASASLPPLPPRKTIGTDASDRFLDQTQRSMGPPPLPARTTYASVALGKSRSRLAEDQGRPANSPSLSATNSSPALREANSFKGRLAAWTSAAQASGGSLPRSESSASLATTSSAFGSSQQRVLPSAQRVLGNAGSAVQKGWAGLRAKGVSGSISSMSNLAGASRRSGEKSNRSETSNPWSSALSRSVSRSTDEKRSIEKDYGGSDGPVFDEGVFKRMGHGRTGRLFGRDLIESGQTWPVYDATELGEDVSEWEKRRKRCLPALVVRAVDYLEIWGPKEEGIFRISGRSSHIARLRKEFDAGADLDLTLCHPGDLDPHAVSGIFKSYLRELPAPILTSLLVPKFDACAKSRLQEANTGGNNQTVKYEDLPAILHQLPEANWFLLADIIKLLILIPEHSSVNRMSLSNLMLVLGPTLNISGHVLHMLLDQRHALFAVPPPLSAVDTAKSLIDFGDINLLGDPVVSEITPSTPEPDSSEPIPSTTPKKTPPRLPKKPSIGRLISNGSSFVASLASATIPISPKRAVREQPSDESISSSIVNVIPPRIELEVSPTSPLPNFISLNDPPSFSSPTDLAGSAPVSARDQSDDVRYPQGTVEERMKLFSSMNSEPVGSTPIADKFKGMASPLLPLRTPKSPLPPSSPESPKRGEFGQPVAHIVNPATVIRRGQNTFFQSSTGPERRARSSTAGSVRSAKFDRSEESSRERTDGREKKESMENLADVEKGDLGAGEHLS